jgi:hypothetical protein
MPRTPIDYSKTIIYKFVCKDTNVKNIYVGHTTSLKDRKREHKSRCNNNYDYKVYQTIRENGGWDNWNMVWVENYPCNNADEASARECEIYQELNADLNSRKPHGLDLERKQTNQKKYYEEHKEHLQQLRKIYEDENREKHNSQKKEWYNNNKEKMKKYREANREKIKAQQQKYREANRDELNRKKREKRKEQS